MLILSPPLKSGPTQMNVDDDTCSDSPPDHPSDAGNSTRDNLSSTTVHQGPPPTSAISPIQQEATTSGRSTTTQTTEPHLKESGEYQKSFLGNIRFSGISRWEYPIKEDGKEPLWS